MEHWKYLRKMQLYYIPTNLFTLRHVKGFHVLFSMLYLILSFYNFFNKLRIWIKKNSKTIMSFAYFDHKIDHKIDHETFTFRLKWQMSPLIRKQKTKTIMAPMKNTPVETETSVFCLENTTEWLHAQKVRST